MPACNICDANIKNFDKTQKCFSCGNKYHAKCLRIDDADLRVLGKYANFRFLCDNCLILEGCSKISSLQQSVEKCLTLIEKQNDNNLSQVQVPSNSANTEKTASYASMVIKKKPTIILQPKDENQLVSTTKKDLLEKVDPFKSNIGISSVKTGRNGSVIISCNNEGDRDKFESLASTTLPDYKIKQLPTLNPRIRISGIDKDIPEDAVVNYLLYENRFLFSAN